MLRFRPSGLSCPLVPNAALRPATSRPRWTAGLGWLSWVLLLALLLGVAGAASAQTANRAAPGCFRADAAALRAAATSPLAAQLTRYTAWSATPAALRAALAAAPREARPGAGPAAVVLTLPRPDGTPARFRVLETQLLDSAFATRRPEVRTYVGVGLDDPQATLRADFTVRGFHAQVLSPSTGTYYVEPAAAGDVSHYLSFYRHDARPGALPPVPCQTDPLALAAPGQARPVGLPTGLDGEVEQVTSSTGSTLRIYRLAVAATGEYTVYQGGTVALAQAAIITTMNRVVGVLEKEVALRFTLVDNTAVVYTDGTTDPYTNNNGSSLLTENQTNLDAVIGTANYDLGHVFGTSGGGLAAVGVLGNSSSKGMGKTGLSTPTGDLFAINYLSHEIGHQLGATHTFNNNDSGNCLSNRSSATAYEPGSGSTIMSYSTQCGTANNISTTKDAYFHTASYAQIQAVIDANTPYSTLSSGNTAPVVSLPVLGARTLPQLTPFKLTATATDADNDALTYCWEELDLGTAGSPTATQVANDNVPLFRTFLPGSTATRYFPQLSDVTSGTSTLGERLPSVARTLTFRCTARDRAISPASNGVDVGGLSYSSSLVLTVDATNSAAFAVTAPNTAVSWTAGSTQTVTWYGAGTKTSAVNCQKVDVLLSTDGGSTFPLILAAGVSNADGTGSTTITVPNLATTTARLMVAAADNYFFDVSDASFTISSVSGPAISSLSATSGVAGSTLTLNGTGFGTDAAALTVTVGGVAATISSATATAVSITVPTSALTGEVLLTKTGSGAGTASGGVFQVTPVLSSLSASSGALGSSLTISGTSLGGATRVSFGGGETTSFTTNTASSPNTITLTVPSNAVSGTVLVYTAGGVSNQTLSFTVTPLTVSSASPTANAQAARESANVSLTLSADLASTAASTSALKVSSRQYGGRRAGTTTASGSKLTFDPTADFRAGETVQVSLASGSVSSSGGASLSAGFVSQFTVRSRAITGLNTASSLTVGTGPRGVAAGDLDGDGDLDLVVANYNGGGSSTVSVLLNSGDGTFTTGTSLASVSSSGPIDNGAEFVLLADLNNDTKLDLLVVCSGGSGSSKVDVLKGNGNGTFTSQTSFTAPYPGEPALGDLNADGNLDLVLPEQYNSLGYALVALGDGSAGFTTSTYTGLSNGPRCLALADVNSDGKLDLLAATYDNGGGDVSGKVSVRLGDGAGSFAAAAASTSQELSATGVTALAVGDFTGDGYLDLAGSRPNATGTPISVWTGTASGSFNTTATVLSPGSTVARMLAGDYNGDGVTDLLAVRSTLTTGRMQVYSYSGSSFGTGTSVALSGNNQPRAVLLADLNNDQALDIVMPSSGTGSSTMQLALAAAGASLPVELVSFTAERVGAGVQLAWRTASEKNSSHFEVQRSFDGRQFERIGQVAGQGSKASSTDYSYLDKQLTTSPSHHLTYYRLKQVDFDGSTSYSPVRAVQLSSSPLHQLTISPNPAHGACTVRGAAPGQCLMLSDALGRLLLTAVAGPDGTAPLVLPAGLPAGVYVLRCGPQAQRLTVE